MFEFFLTYFLIIIIVALSFLLWRDGSTGVATLNNANKTKL